MKSFYRVFSGLRSNYFLFFFFLIFTKGLCGQTTFTVTSPADNADANLSDNICADANGNCTLRAAIENANKAAATDKVHFAIAGEGPHTILLNDDLPLITEPIVLDATTQPGYSFQQSQIVLDGSRLEDKFDSEETKIPRIVFYLSGNSSGSEISGFTIGGISSTFSVGIYALDTGNHSIFSNKIGCTPDGSESFSNSGYGIYLQKSNSNIIGGSEPEYRNILSGNNIAIALDYANQNNIQNNYIGTNISGQMKIGNGRAGIYTWINNQEEISGGNPSSNNTIISNLISGNNTGISLQGSTNLVESNIIGTNISGTDTIPNLYGVHIGAGKYNEIGKVQGNLISGNQTGLLISSSENIVKSNYIGTTMDGKNALPNIRGIYVQGWEGSTSGKNRIENNLLSGNTIALSLNGAAENIVLGNTIGTDLNGTYAIGNSLGIKVNVSNHNVIGGPGLDEGNVISGNDYGIELESSDSNRIFGNWIGTDPSGTYAIRNKRGIVLVSGNENLVGGSGTGEGNVISGNYEGMRLERSNSNSILGNKIGVGADAISPLPNETAGIWILSSGNQIGGISPGEGNTIAMNGELGIIVASIDAINNQISGNSFFGSPLGIAIGGTLLVENDHRDVDSGPNNYQNFPVLESGKVVDSNLEFSYFIDSDPQYSTYPITIEVFRSDGNRQGKEYLSTHIITENKLPKGKQAILANISLPENASLKAGDLITATATDANGNTSIFSTEIAVSGDSGCTEETYYADNDSDGFGDPASTLISCSVPKNYVSNAEDCDDTDATINPDAVDDTIDGIDQNCDGTDGPAACQGSDILNLSEICSTSTTVQWQVNNPGSCATEGWWELRKSSNSGPDSGSFAIGPGEEIYLESGISAKGNTQLILYWADSAGMETKTSLTTSGIDCSTLSYSSQNFSEANDFYVSPNPIDSGSIGMYFSPSQENSLLTISVYDQVGRQVATGAFTVRAGVDNFLWEVDHSTWAPGTYILNADWKGQIYRLQFVK